jgi:hypothetical protein
LHLRSVVSLAGKFALAHGRSAVEANALHIGEKG